MNTYLCMQLEAGKCLNWQEFTVLALEKGQGLQIGYAFLGLTATAWCIQLLAYFFIKQSR